MGVIMLQKKLFDGTKVPAIWQGGAGIVGSDIQKQSKVWVEGIRFGCNAIDTAERYGNGLSEQIVGETLKKVNRSDVFIATKVAPENLSELELVHACKRSLKRLGTDYIDLYQIHWNNPLIPIELTLDTMMKLRNEGKIRYIGVCNFTLPQIEQCNEILNGELATVQVEYNLVNRLAERDIIPYCEEMGILLLGYAPLNSGHFNYSNSVMKSIVRKNRRTASQITLNWLTAKYNVSVLPKTSNLRHLIENAQSTDFELTDEDFCKIDDAYKKDIVKLKPSSISVEHSIAGIEGNLSAYKTVEEAIENRFNQSPSPSELAKEVKETKQLSKPIFVHYTDGQYELASGSIRYWAWVIAFGMDAEIECIITHKEAS